MILAAFLSFFAQPGLPDALVNPDFEAHVPETSYYGSRTPPGWSVREARGYRVHVEPRGGPHVVGPTRSGHVATLGYFARNAPDRGSSIGISQTIDARRWRGRRIRVSVEAKPAHFAANRAWLTVEAGSARGRRGFEVASQWRRYAVELDVPRDAPTISVTIATNGDVEIDDVRIERVR